MNHVHNTPGRTQGFTLIELMLAMTFIAVLLVLIAMTTIQVSNIYTKGTTLKEVNQAGRSVSAELQRTIAASGVFALSPTHYATSPGGGRLCVGQTTYAWNYGAALAGGAGAPAVMNTDIAGNPINFVKIPKAGTDYCTNLTKKIDPADNPAELLSEGDRDLALHKFIIETTPSATDLTTGQALYTISMVIGTNDRVQLTTNDSSCRPPSEMEGGEDFCSVNRFDIVARAGNELGE